jgi:hypothetical protein
MKELMNLPLRALPIVIILIIGVAIDIDLAYDGGVFGIIALFLFYIKLNGLRDLINYYKKL